MPSSFLQPPHKNSAISVGLSPCPNDVFSFEAWIHNRIPNTPFPLIPYFADIQSLNQMALQGDLDVCKVSFFCLGKILKDYIMLPSGAALGWGCGPKLVSNQPLSLNQIPFQKIAVPGLDTTAYLLLKLLIGDPLEVVPCGYENVLTLIASGVCSCGILIHETRFTFQEAGFIEITDLGQLYEERFQGPLPLGVIVAKRTLSYDKIDTISQAIHDSINYAFNNPSISLPYVLDLSIEKDRAIVEKHINLYVTRESQYISAQGIKSITHLLQIAYENNLIPKPELPILFNSQNPYHLCHIS